MIEVVIIDDSAFMRKALELMLESDPDIKVVATARDGMEGFEKVVEYQPDIVTLDIEMPRTGGLECLDMIMKDAPTPVLVVSSITTDGAAITLEALDKGAVDFIPKTQSFVAIDITQIKDDLLVKVKSIVKQSSFTRFKKRRRKKYSERPSKLSVLHIEEAPQIHYLNNVRCVAIGVSTGGPPVVQTILSSLPEDFPAPIVIAQHMPKEFTKTFSERLNNVSKINVKEAETGDVIIKGNAYIAQGGKHLVVKRRGVNVIGELTVHPTDNLYHPSADVLFSSATDVFGSFTLGVILTGMGRDGVEGLKKLKDRGGSILAQNEESCIVYGMPKAAVEVGVVDSILSIGEIVASLNSLTNHKVKIKEK